MAKIREPRDPRVSGDTIGPNSPNRIDPDFNDPFRSNDGDTRGAGDFAGRKKTNIIPPAPFPIRTS